MNQQLNMNLTRRAFLGQRHRLTTTTRGTWVLGWLSIFTFAPLAFAQVTIDFEDLTLAPETAEIENPFTSGGAGFNNFYDDTFGPFWSGWSYTNITDTTTAGFTNQHGNITGSGFGGSDNFGVGFVDLFNGVTPTITLPAGQFPESIRVTNTTYAYLAILDGNDGSGFVRQFGDSPGNGLGQGNEGEPDFFRLTVNGFDAASNPTGSTSFLLADYTFADNADDFVVDQWELLDLTGLGDATTLEFDLETTDTGPFGANTPFFFAVDDLILGSGTNNTVPEPGTLWLAIIAAGLALLTMRHVRRR